MCLFAALTAGSAAPAVVPVAAVATGAGATSGATALATGATAATTVGATAAAVTAWAFALIQARADQDPGEKLQPNPILDRLTI